MRYYVMAHSRIDGEDDIVEAIRTHLKPAEQDVRVMKDIVGRHTWIEERDDGRTPIKSKGRGG